MNLRKRAADLATRGATRILGYFSAPARAGTGRWLSPSPRLLILGALSAGAWSLPGGLSAKETPEPVSLQLKWRHQFQFAGYYAAQAKGYYAAENLDVRIIEGGAQRPALAAVLNGDAQFGVGDTDALLARMNGRPIVVCAAIFQHSPCVLLSRLDRKIRTPADLVGKTVMLADDQGDAQLRAMLAQEGIDAKLVTTRPHTWKLDDLLAGKVDAQSAYATVEPAMLRALGIEPAMLRSVDYGVDFYGDTLFTTKAEIAGHPQRTEGFVRASLKGWEYAMTHPEEMAALIAKMDGVAARGLTVERLQQEAAAMQPYILRDVVEIGHMNPGRWQQIAATFASLSMAPRGFDLTGLIYEPHPVREAFRWRWLFIGGATLLATAGLALLWSAQLRKRVRLRTGELQTEIAHRHRVEQELLASEELFRQLAENINEVFWIFDLDRKKILYVSPAYLTVWGRRCETMYQSPTAWHDSLHPADREHVLAAQAAQTSGNYNETYRILRPDGSVRWIHDRAFPVRDPLGKIYRIVGVAKDITERRAAEDKLKEQASLLDKARDAICVRDLQHRAQYINRSAELLYGWTAAELIGRSVRELAYVDPTSFDKAMQTLLQRGDWSGEVSQATKDGRLLTIESRWSLVRDEHAEPLSVLVIDTDVTERKKLEQQFLRAQRMESIGTLAGGIAHDLNNLLAPILMGVELLKLFETREPSLKVIGNIENSAKRGANLVKQVLSFARGVEGARVLVQLSHIVREIESIAENTFPKNISIETHIANNLQPVVGDPTQLNQVLLNLCVNARDALPDGGRLTLSVQNVALDAHAAAMLHGVAPGRYVRVEVADTGTGIPPEVSDRIFEPFFTTKETGKGTGLGLSTALGIVRSHGGFLNVTSQPGQGSRFQVYLPAQTDESAESNLDQEAAKLCQGDGELILLVDDEAAILSVTQQTLEAFGYRVITAADGAVAIALFAQHQADIAVVLTDMMMPVMDGAALIAALRHRSPDVRIIAASGLKTDAKSSQADTTGIRHFLAKPYTAEALLRALRNILGKDSRPPVA